MIPKDYRPAEDEEEKGGKKKKKKRGVAGPKRRMRKAVKTMVGRKNRLGGGFSNFRPGGIGNIGGNFGSGNNP